MSFNLAIPYRMMGNLLYINTL